LFKIKQARHKQVLYIRIAKSQQNEQAREQLRTHPTIAPQVASTVRSTRRLFTCQNKGLTLAE